MAFSVQTASLRPSLKASPHRGPVPVSASALPWRGRPASRTAWAIPAAAVVLLVAAARPAESQHGFGGMQGGGGWVSWASTAQQGADMGLAAVVSARGHANLMNSEAAKNWEDAKTLEIQNRMRWTETYFEMRKANREARAAEEGPRVTHEQAIRLAKSGMPPRLGSTQLDPVTGHIEYPLALTAKMFAPYRAELDKLFADRAASGGSMQFEQYQEIQQTVTRFIEALKQHVADFAAGDYGRARTFLDSIANESRFPAG